MRSPALVVLFLAFVMAGCIGAPGAKSPLYAPKLVVDHTEDDRIQLFVHGALQERSYDQIVLHVDNRTIVKENHTLASVAKIHARSFYLGVEVDSQDGSTFTFEGLMELQEDNDHLLVVPFTDGDWEDDRRFNLPHEHILERQEEAAS